MRWQKIKTQNKLVNISREKQIEDRKRGEQSELYRARGGDMPTHLALGLNLASNNEEDVDTLPMN